MLCTEDGFIDVNRTEGEKEFTKDVTVVNVIKLRGGKGMPSWQNFFELLQKHGEIAADEIAASATESARGFLRRSMEEGSDRVRSWAHSEFRRLGLRVQQRAGNTLAIMAPDNEQARKVAMPRALQKVRLEGNKKHMYGVIRMVKELRPLDIYYTLNYWAGTSCPEIQSVAVSALNNVFAAGTVYDYKYFKGFGPGLYMETCPFDSYSQNTVDYTQFGMIMTPYFIAGGYQANPAATAVRTYNAAGLPINANIALFAVNYPFQTMLPLTATQDITKPECFLGWNEDNQYQTNDPYFPLKFTTLAGNLDWSKVIVHGTELKIVFTNNFPCDVTVEVHLFKIIPDVDAFTSVGQIIALGTNSMINYDQYCRNGIKKWGIPQTITIKRDRFTLKCQNYQAASSILSTTTANAFFLGNNPRHQVTKTYMIKQKYSYVRPVSLLYEAVAPTETAFFNTYHDHQNSIYCKIMAWQKDGLTTQWVALNETAADVTTQQYGLYRSQYQINNMNNVFSIASATKGTNAVGYPVSGNNQDTIGRPLVEYKMTKRTFLQTDKIMLMGPFNPT